jgi:hypothetical protein
MIINGLPLHPLVVHAAVVFVPLMLVFAVLLFIPKIRKAMTYAAGITGIVAFLFVALANQSGEALQQLVPNTQAVVNHVRLAQGVPLIVFVAGGILTVLAILELPKPVALVRFRHTLDSLGWVMPLGRILGLIMAMVAVYFVYNLGESGALAVWGGRFVQ